MSEKRFVSIGAEGDPKVGIADIHEIIEEADNRTYPSWVTVRNGHPEGKPLRSTLTAAQLLERLGDEARDFVDLTMAGHAESMHLRKSQIVSVSGDESGCEVVMARDGGESKVRTSLPESMVLRLLAD